MLVRICSAKPHDKGTQYLVPLTTYILVEKRTINKQSKVCSKVSTSGNRSPTKVSRESIYM